MKNWIKRNKRVYLHFISASYSWLNLVERFFGIIMEKQIRRYVFSLVKDLEHKIKDFIESYNKNSKPFVWRKNAERIINRVGRAKFKMESIYRICDITLVYQQQILCLLKRW